MTHERDDHTTSSDGRREPCQELREQLHEFIDSEIAVEDCRRLNEHIKTCSSCREAAENETHLRVLLRRSCAEVAPATLRMRVITEITMMRGGSPAVIERRSSGSW